MRAIFSLLLLVLISFSCKHQQANNEVVPLEQYITVLGVAQDAGFPQINCQKACCSSYYQDKVSKKLISCLGLVDLEATKKYLFDATPDIIKQTHVLNTAHLDNGQIIDGIFLTHAHIGHYVGLMYLGHEAMSANGVPVYAMPRMKSYLEANGPWSQLVSYDNIDLLELKTDSTIVLTNQLKVTPFLVPHRDEFSETVGYKVEGKDKSALFIPDINKWELWERSIIEEVKKVDYAFLDATFFKDGEIARPMNEVAHPFIVETTKLFENETMATKSKIYFIHFNHTNPALQTKSILKDSIQNLGFNFAREGMKFPL